MDMRFRILLLTCCLFAFANIQGQSIATEFGKNRVQYHNDKYNWSRYETENFVTYWYGKARNIAQPTIQLAERDHEEIQKILEHTLSRKLEIIVYTDLTDLKQSNIGLNEAFTNKEKTTKVDGSKILVYFDGDHQKLRTQIRKGISAVYLNSVLYGSNLQEIVQNSILLNLPNWFGEGLISYSDQPWDRFIEDEFRDLIIRSKKLDFEKLMEEHPRVVGHSLWYFIAETYGSSNIANIVYLTRISRSLNNSFLFVLGEEFDVIMDKWTAYFRNYYSIEKNNFNPTDESGEFTLKNIKGVPISKYRISPNGNYLAYVVNDRSKERVYIRDLSTGKERLILKNGYKNIFQEPDYNYPLIAWHPSYPELSIIYEKRDIAWLRRYDVKDDSSEEEEMTKNFQRVYSMSYIAPEEYLLSATTDGYSDLYHYKSDNRHHTRITEDFYDDLDAEYVSVNGKKAILFKSNRTEDNLEKSKIDTILPVQNFDLFLLMGLSAEDELIRLTRTPNVNERLPYMNNDNKIVYIHGSSGIENIYEHDLTTGDITPLTNAERNIIKHHTVPKSADHFYNYYYFGNYVNLNLANQNEAITPPYRTTLSKKLKQSSDVIIPFLPKNEKEQVQLEEGMMFQSQFDDAEDLQPIQDTETKEVSDKMFEKYFKDYYSDSYLDGKRIIKFKSVRASAYRNQFRLADFQTKLDNSVLFEGLESFTGENTELNTVPTSILLKGIIKDLLENYEINVGLRIPTRFNGYEYFVTMDDNLKTWDKRVAIYRRVATSILDQNSLDETRDERRTFIGLVRFKYPFSVYSSLRLTPSLRFDRYFLQATDTNSFESGIDFEQRLSFKAEFVFDNSYDVSLNIKNGTRLKIYAEGINQFDFDFVNGIDLDFSTAVTGVFGVDARHYIPVFRKAVLALRGAAATSIGTRRVVYYLGGVEQWIGASQEEGIPVPSGTESAFRVLAPHLRGFRNNIRNGNSFALTNTEFRLPIAHFIGLGRSSFGFFRNLQLTSFFDAGLAWFGVNPDSEENTLNTVMVSSPENNPSIIVNARFFRAPLIYGYGFGVRSTVLGYFVKFDYGWGVENGMRRDPRFYFSLGMDF